MPSRKAEVNREVATALPKVEVAADRFPVKFKEVPAALPRVEEAAERLPLKLRAVPVAVPKVA